MIYSTLSDTPIRTRLMRWTAPLFLTLTCCTLISHQESLSTLAQRLDGTNDETQLQHLESKIQELEQFILTAQQADDTATRSAINNMRDEVNEHFEGIELALTAHVSRQDLKPLLQRIELIEASHQRPMQSLPHPKAPTESRRKKLSLSSRYWAGNCAAGTHSWPLDWQVSNRWIRATFSESATHSRVGNLKDSTNRPRCLSPMALLTT
ncbi:hypothetical protein QZH47_05690 [Pseudomonas corrugata]